jgi:hypothetical protein
MQRKLYSMTTEEFSRGGERAEREALRGAIELAIGAESMREIGLEPNSETGSGKVTAIRRSKQVRMGWGFDSE